MNRARPPFKYRLSLGGLMVPLFSLGLLLVSWRLDMKWMVAPVIVFVLFYYLFLPRLVRSRMDRFHRQALMLLTSGKATEVPALARRNIVLQLLGPSGPIDAKLGLALAQSGDFARAIPYLESAIPTASDVERPALTAGLVKSLFVTGDLGRAEAEGRAMLDRMTRLPEILAIVARCRIGLGKVDDHTRGLLDEAAGMSPSPDVDIMIRLTRIESQLLTGRKPGELPEGADSSQRFLRGWIHLVRGQLREHRGDREKAQKSFGSAMELAGDSFISAVAREHVESDAAEGDEVVGDAPGRDPAVRRKKKRRR